MRLVKRNKVAGKNNVVIFWVKSYYQKTFFLKTTIFSFFFFCSLEGNEKQWPKSNGIDLGYPRLRGDTRAMGEEQTAPPPQLNKSSWQSPWLFVTSDRWWVHDLCDLRCILQRSLVEESAEFPTIMRHRHRWLSTETLTFVYIMSGGSHHSRRVWVLMSWSCLFAHLLHRSVASGSICAIVLVGITYARYIQTSSLDTHTSQSLHIVIRRCSIGYNHALHVHSTLSCMIHSVTS